MGKLRQVHRVRAPIERCFDLARSVEAHVASTGHTGERAVAGVTTGLLELNDEVTWRARHLGVWQRLRSRITAFDRPRHFRDSMVAGAFARFDHDHFFEPDPEVDGVCVMTDGSRNFFGPSRKLNRRGVKSVLDPVGSRTEFRALEQVPGACGRASLVGRVVAIR